MNKEKLFSIGALVILVVAVGLYGIFGLKKGTQTAEETKADNVALVNGIAITRATFNTQLAQATTSLKAQGQDVDSPAALTQIKTQVLQSLVDNEVVAQEIAKANIAPTQAQIDAQYQALVTQLGGQDKLNAQETQAGLTDAQVRANLTKQLAIQMYLSANVSTTSITVSEDEIKQYYTDNTKGQTNPPTLKSVHDQIKQQIINTKQQTLVNEFIASLRAKAQVQTSL